MTAIAKCHFCGSDDVATFTDNRLVAVACSTCGYSGPAFDTRHCVGNLTATQAAVKSHNEMRAVGS